jgi:hypothetical protein
MKLFRLLAAVALLGTAQMAYSANYDCDPCDPCYTGPSCDICDIDFCDMEFSVYVDALYWKTNHGNLSYEFPLVEGDEPDRHSLCGDYNWGYRLGAAASWNGWDLGLRYTSLKTSTSRSHLSTDELGEVIVLTDDLRVSHKVDFQVLDLELGRTCCVCEGVTLRPFVGGKFAWIDSKRKFDNTVTEIISVEPIVTTNNEVKDSIDFDGKGLYIGFDSRWELCSFDLCDMNVPLALVTRASTGILDADFDHKSTFEDLIPTETSITSSSISKCHYVPVHELYAGLEFAFCGLCNMDAFVQVGYEVQYWGFEGYTGFFDVFSLDNSSTHLGMGGLVLRFGAGF